MARVLIVDDDVELSQILELAVCRRGHDVRVATSRFEAYSVGVEFRPDVLVVDWYITVNFDGLELAQVLRAGLPQLQVMGRRLKCSLQGMPSRGFPFSSA